MSNLGKNSKRGGNPSFDLYQLKAINRIKESLETLIPGSLATEATLISVLNAVIASNQDIEVLLVRDEGAADKVVQQVTDYQSGVPVVSYKTVDGDPYTVIGPIVYLDPSGVLNLILSNLTSNVDAKLSTLATEATQGAIKGYLTPATRTHNTINTSTTGNVPLGTFRGSVFNIGDAPGVWNGISLPAGVSIPWGEVGIRDTYGLIPYDATGTIFIIEYTT